MAQEELRKLPFYDSSLGLETRVDDLFQRLTFHEKCLLCAGEGDNAPPAIERLGIPRFGMTDGPHGVSPHRSGVGPNGVANPDAAAGTSTYFPTGIQLASTWNPPLIVEFGSALAEETRAVGRFMQLGPSMNICRNPMNGRTFEYFSEDPLLSGEIGAAAVQGMQSKRIAPCVKHYAVNNFETNRFKVNVVVSPRALEEIYLAGFKRVVQKADPWGIMSAYNKVNGTYVSEHRDLLRTHLKDLWGFRGVVVSDWGATKHCTSIKNIIEAGMDVEMGSRNRFNIGEMELLKGAGEFPEQAFDDNIRRLLRVMFLVGTFDDPARIPLGKINTPEHQAVARKLAEEGMVLLKNERKLLPLDITRVRKIAILGKHADLKFGRKKLGGGSSAVLPPYEVTVRAGLQAKCKGRVEIVADPADADVAVVVIGLEHSHDFKGGDHEGSDRLRYSLGVFQPRLVNATLKKNPNTVVVCVNGAPFGMEKFAGKVPAILEAWYGGMEVGNVVADILFGDVNPSGKLPVSWPKCKRDIPTAFSFFRTVIGAQEVRYDEDIFVGYRYYDSHHVEPRFCFGHGLSYSSFAYTGLTLTPEMLRGDGTLHVTFTLKNVGDRDGAEVTQLYLSNRASTVPQPQKFLAAFQKQFLKAGASTTVTYALSKTDLAYYSEAKSAWITDPGQYEIFVGTSSRSLPLRGKFIYQD